MNRTDTFETICAIIESFAEELPFQVEDVAAAIMADLEHQGEEILTHLHPPVGLQRWLVSHGLVLVPVREAPAPKVWDALAEQDEVEAEIVEERPFYLQVGDLVAYQTYRSGPRGQSQIGHGKVVAISGDHAWVYVYDGSRRIALGVDDLIRPLTPPDTPERSVQAPSW